jgi:antitoxin component HigA of HigAB toxin-antitoxin module
MTPGNRNFEFHPIRSDREHADALQVLTVWQIQHSELSESDPKAKELEEKIYVLGLIVSDFERHRFPIEAPSQGELLRFLMEQHGLKQTDFENEIGAQPVVSEILRGRRRLTVEHIRKLSQRFGVSPELFVNAKADAA